MRLIRKFATVKEHIIEYSNISMIKATTTKIKCLFSVSWFSRVHPVSGERVE